MKVDEARVLINVHDTVTWTHIHLSWRSKVTWVKVKGHIGQGNIRVPNKGSWAHINVKLLSNMLDGSISFLIPLDTDLSNQYQTTFLWLSRNE